MSRITNKLYREFLDKGSIQIMNIDDIEVALNRVSGKHVKEARSLIIIAYYTGARPAEYLELKAKDITKEKHYLVIQMPAAKGGLVRPIRLKVSLPFVKDLWIYTSSRFMDMYLFHNFRSNYKRVYKTKKGDFKVYKDISNKLRYYFSKWFNNAITPYFLRHNRFSKLAQKGVDREDMRIMKGSRTYESITPYVHMSLKQSKKIAGKID